jgi:carboxyl-terminal processing protease
VPPTHAARWTIVLVFVGAFILCPPARANSPAIEKLRHDAEAFEKQGAWDDACDVYERILRLDRDAPGIKARYIQCIRRLWQSRRHHDDSYRKEVLSIEYGQAVHLYIVVRDLLLDQSLERKKLNPARLFRKGVEELDYALADPFFIEQHVPPDRLYKVAEFRAMLRQTWGDLNPASRKEAVKQVCDIAMAAQAYLRISTSVVIMELTCGACYALDEYTVYLTPAQLRDLFTSLRGPVAGIGVALVLQDNKVLIHQVDLGSPAARAALTPNDEIISIDKKGVVALPIEAVAAMLEGPPGSIVELEVISPAFGMRAIAMRREAMILPSVSPGDLLAPSIGYIKISAFQESTPKEVDDAIARLTESGMKALVLDLRGNGGGMFEAAVEVARRFLSTGIIATKQQLDEKGNIITTLCEAKNPAALTFPLVVLIDAETASSAEVLAGALKDNARASLVGQSTYGKGCTQFVLKLPDFKGGLPAGGMRLTVAKVFSPKGLPYTGRGVLPDVAVEMDAMMPSPSPSMMMLDAQRTAAQLEAQRLLMMAPR